MSIWLLLCVYLGRLAIFQRHVSGRFPWESSAPFQLVQCLVTGFGTSHLPGDASPSSSHTRAKRLMEVAPMGARAKRQLLMRTDIPEESIFTQQRKSKTASMQNLLDVAHLFNQSFYHRC